LALQLDATYVRIDMIEDALLIDGGGALVAQGAGYRVAYAIVEENLKLGRTVIADSVNPIRMTRLAWRDVAKRSGVAIVDVVVVCSDKAQHQRRIEARPKGARGSVWPEVLNREFDAVDCDAVVIDTAGQSVEQSLGALQMALNAQSR
jgi:predicted kinase